MNRYDQGRYFDERHAPAQFVGEVLQHDDRVLLLSGLGGGSGINTAPRLPSEARSQSVPPSAAILTRAFRRRTRRCSFGRNGRASPCRQRSGASRKHGVWAQRLRRSSGVGLQALRTIQASGGGSRGVASFARRIERSREAGSHHSMRSWLRIVPPSTIRQFRPERLISGLKTRLPSRVSK
jgi:hypothetical protein